jgi:hypothetical protein
MEQMNARLNEQARREAINLIGIFYSMFLDKNIIVSPKRKNHLKMVLIFLGSPGQN